MTTQATHDCHHGHGVAIINVALGRARPPIAVWWHVDLDRRCDDPEPTPREVVHLSPYDGSGVTRCCGRTPLELSRTDRITTDPTAATCTPREDRP